MARSRFAASIPPITFRLLIATAVATLVCVLGRSYGLLEAFVFEPIQVIPGLRLWKLLSYVFVTGLDPIGFLFDLLVLYFFGGWFERAFGPRRFLIFFAASAVGAALLPLGIGLFSESVAAFPYYGAWSVFEALTVAMGLLQPTAQVYFYMIIPVTAGQLMFLSWGLIALFIVFGHSVVPFLTAIGGVGMGFLLTTGVSGLRGPRRLWLRFQAARLERQLRKRAQHLRVVPPASRETPPGSGSKDKNTYLH